MFVKIRYWNVKRKTEGGVPVTRELNREATYDCVKISVGPEIPEPPNVDVTRIILIMDVGEQDERILDIPVNSPTEETEIYLMNDEGKTIDKYIY